MIFQSGRSWQPTLCLQIPVSDLEIGLSNGRLTEQIGYELDARFAAEPTSAFTVEDEVQGRMDPGLFQARVSPPYAVIAPRRTS